MISSSIAIILCLLFCAYVYWKDAQRDTDVSAAIWIPILWMMRCASRSITVWLYPSGYEGMTGEGSVHDEIYLGSLILLGLIILIRRKVNLTELFAKNTWLFMLYGLMMISTFWSDIPGISLKRFIRTVGDFIMILVVLTEIDSLEAIKTLFRKTCILLIPLSVVLVRYFPNIGKHASKHWEPDYWIGVATHKNTLGQLCLIAAIYFIWDLFWSRKKGKIAINIIYLLMTLFLLNGEGYSRSTTSILLTIIVVFMFFMLERTKENPSKIWKIIFISVIVFAFLQVGLMIFNSSVYNLTLEFQGRDATLTGRTDLWHYLIPLGMKHPLFGYGFQGFWTPQRISFIQQIEIFSWGPAQAHNGYLEIFLNLGLSGLIIFIIVAIRALHGAFKQCKDSFEYGKIRIILLLVVLLHNYTESGFLRPTHLMWFIFLLVAVTLSRNLSLLHENLQEGQYTEIYVNYY